MDSFDMSDKKKAIIATTWEYLLKTGLSNASIGELCKETLLASPNRVRHYGISKVVDALLDFTFDHTTDIRKYFDSFLDEVEKYKYELRLAIQITTSPLFGERMRIKAKDFRLWYEKYAGELIKIFGCTYEQAETFIYSIIAFVIDYAIWDDRDKTQMLLENLYDRIMRIVDVSK